MNEILLAIFWYVLAPIFVLISLRMLWSVYWYFKYVIHFLIDQSFYVVNLDSDGEYRVFGNTTDFLYFRGKKEEALTFYNTLMDVKSGKKR